MTRFPACPGPTRRDALKFGSVAVAAAAAGPALAHKARGADHTSNDPAVIFVWLPGGPPHQDTFDMKPDAPAEVRGPYEPVPSAVPGSRVCEHLPLLARRADKFAVVRSVRSDDANHNTSLILTGHHATIGGTALTGVNPGIPSDRPFFMSAVDHARGGRGYRRPAPCRHACASRTGSGCSRATTAPAPTAASSAPGSTRSAPGSATPGRCCSSRTG